MLSSRGARPTRARTSARFLAVAALVAIGAGGLTFSAPTAAVAAAKAPVSHLPPRIEVRADNVGFYPYSDATLLSAEGHVHLRAGSRRISADSVRLDLKSNKLIASGNVVVMGHTSTLYVTAYALDLKTDAAEAIRLDPTPRTLALVDDNLSSAKEGPAPSDTFGVADLSGQRPYIQSTHAVITTNANVRMTPAIFPTAAGAHGVLPTFVYTYQYNQLFGAQALQSTTIDYPYTLFGTPNSLTALHARYSQYDGIEVGLDEHLVDGNREYIVGSILPFRGRRIDLNSFQIIRPGLTHQFTGYLVKGITYGTYSLQQTAREFSLKALTTVTNGYNNESMTLSSNGGYVHHVARYQATIGYGYEHNPGQNPFYGDFNTLMTAQVNSASIPLGHGIYTSAQYNYSLQKYDVPHLVVHNTTTLSLSSPTVKLSRNGSRAIQFYGSTSFDNYEVRYRNDISRFLGLPNPQYEYFAPDGSFDPGYFAYDGITTDRTYQLSSTYTAPHDFRFQLTLTHAHDFPQGHGIGRSPLQIYGDMTFRLSSTLKLEVNRTYSFAVDGERFSQYGFSLSP